MLEVRLSQTNQQLHWMRPWLSRAKCVKPLCPLGFQSCAGDANYLIVKTRGTGSCYDAVAISNSICSTTEE